MNNPVSNRNSMTLFKRFLMIDPLVFLSLTLILYILRMVGPYVNYVFIPFLLLYLLFTSYHIITQFKSVRIFEFLRINIYLLLISVFFLFGFIISSVFIFPIFKELLNIFIFIFIALSFFIFVKNLGSLQKFNEIFCKQLVFFSFIVSIFGLIKFYFLLSGTEPSLLNNLFQILGTSLNADYNFYSLFSIIGIISIISGLKYFSWGNTKKGKKAMPIFLLFLSLNILFSYSRRGFLIFLIIVLVSIIIIIANYKKKDNLFFIISNWIASFMVLLFLFVLILISPVKVKRNVLDFLGISISSYIYASSSILYRYSTIFSVKDYDYFQKIVWLEKPDPKRPDLSWGSKSNTTIFPLPGDNVGIVPENSVGYKIDSTCDASAWSNNAYSYTDISSLFQGDSIKRDKEFYYASVYCYVSKDFDGSWVRISTEGNSYGKIISEYDLNHKGVWQKLTIWFKNTGGLSPVYLYCAKNGVTDFSSLNGDIIFAYPEYRITLLDPKNPGTGWGTERSTLVFPLIGANVELVPESSIGYKMDSTCGSSTWSGSAFSFTNISSLFQSDSITATNELYHSSVYCFVSKDFDGSWARISAEGGAYGKIVHEYDMNRKGVWQKLQINFTSKSGIPPVYLYWCKYGVTDFQNMNGYVIYAYPEYSRQPSVADRN